MPSWTDIHAHLNMLEGPTDQILEQALQNNVKKVITIGTNPKDNPVALQLAEDFYPRVQCCLGAHPHDASAFNALEEEYLLEQYDKKYVVGVGEIGLDYYYNQSPQDVQKAVFRRMLEIALLKDLPVQIHTRDAEEDTVNILKEFNGKVTGVIHCFTGSKWLAEEVLKLGLNISFSGIVTFKNADDLRETLKMVPLERLHVETDSPFLAPVPLRGKKNEPANVIHTAELVAQVKGISVEELLKVTHENALKVFKKLDYNY